MFCTYFTNYHFTKVEALNRPYIPRTYFLTPVLKYIRLTGDSDQYSFGVLVLFEQELELFSQVLVYWALWS